MCLIFWEMMAIIMMLVFLGQGSAFYKSLILIPFSLTSMVMMMSLYYYSGFLFFIFVMIFVGGLMILLVSITSTLSQEQGIVLLNKSVVLVIISVLLFFQYCIYMKWMSVIFMVKWIFMLNLVVFIGVLLMLALMVITIQLMEYKVMMRGICPVGVMAHFPFAKKVSDSHDNCHI